MFFHCTCICYSHVHCTMYFRYAWSESSQCSGTTGAECQTLGVNASVYVARTNQEFAKVGLLGITMLSASGDSGCHGRTEGFCIFQKDMKPDYPAS